MSTTRSTTEIAEHAEAVHGRPWNGMKHRQKLCLRDLRHNTTGLNPDQALALVEALLAHLHCVAAVLLGGEEHYGAIYRKTLKDYGLVE